MPAYNHTKRGVVEQTKDFVTMYQDGSLHCSHAPCTTKYIGKTSLGIQRHFEAKHNFTFGHTMYNWLPSDGLPIHDHMAVEGIQ